MDTTQPPEDNAGPGQQGYVERPCLWEVESIKRQDLLSKLGAWEPWGWIEGRRGEAGRGAEKNVELNKYQ